MTLVKKNDSCITIYEIYPTLGLLSQKLYIEDQNLGEYLVADAQWAMLKFNKSNTYEY